MREDRGASQILFGLLPEQTADFSARVWRVREWVDPLPLSIDSEVLRQELLSSIAPWSTHKQDGGFANDLHNRTPVEVVTVNKQRGAVVEPFPRLWRCKGCNRIHRAPHGRCECGQQQRAQLHFVAYHDCGAIAEPFIPFCSQHNQSVIHLPGSASAAEIVFTCPVCNRKLGQGFLRGTCSCGTGPMNVTVHRASVVYTPRFLVLVNPPDPAAAARLRAAGGGARALEWVLGGLAGQDTASGGQTAEGLLETLRQQGISEETARQLVAIAEARGEITTAQDPSAVARLSPEAREQAHDEALKLASAVVGGRVRVAELIEHTTPPLRTLYETAYRNAVAGASLEDVEFLPAFPVATLSYGYTRGTTNPGASRLVAFRQKAIYRAYGQRVRTEALLFRLDPTKVYEWLVSRSLAEPIEELESSRARIEILNRFLVPMPGDENVAPIAEATLGLVHSFAHRAIRMLAAFSGIERDGLAEYLVPAHLSFIVYASSRGEFCLGGLQAVFETNLHEFLDALVNSESRCPLDPGCRTGGGACTACLHIGEPSCRWFNRFLRRDVLFGRHGYLR